MSKMLGLSFFYHDSAAALLIDGKPVAMSEEERFSRKKHDSGFPSLAIKFVLESSGVSLIDLDYVVFYEKPFLKFDRIFKTLMATFPSHPKVFVEAVKHLFLDKLWIRSLIAKELGVPSSKILFCEHHLAHAASAFYPSPFQDAAVVTVDGVGEWAVTTIGRGAGSTLEILREIRFPHSIGLLYSAFTAFLGFEVNEGEYKVMGMAPYGKPKYVEQIKKLVNFYEDGSYSLNLEYFSFHKSLTRTYSDKFLELFGTPRDPKSKFFTRETGWPSYFGVKPEGVDYERLAVEQERYADLAASIQAVAEELLIHLARAAFKLTGLRKLCLAGGVALNSVANFKILQQTEFEEVFVQPAAGDAGGALGAALAVYHLGLKGSRGFVMEHAYYGKSYTNDEIAKFVSDSGLSARAKFVASDSELYSTVSDALIAGKVIGWFSGKFEWGPRALGSRSIIADARRNDMKDIVNTKIKFREPYRPFAPSVLAEHADEIFDFGKGSGQYPSRYMLYVVPVREEKQKTVPAITHVDGSARPQLVYSQHSPRYHALISKFYEKTGVPLILNTSFNLKGEPIVTSPEDAFKTFSKSEMDLLVLENYIISK